MEPDSAFHERQFRHTYRASVCGARTVSPVRQWQLRNRQWRGGEWLRRRRFRVQLTASQGAEAADWAFDHAHHFYLEKNHDRRRESAPGLRRLSQWWNPGLEKSALRSRHQ